MPCRGGNYPKVRSADPACTVRNLNRNPQALPRRKQGAPTRQPTDATRRTAAGISLVEHWFKLAEHRTDVRTELQVLFLVDLFDASATLMGVDHRGGLRLQVSLSAGVLSIEPAACRKDSIGERVCRVMRESVPVSAWLGAGLLPFPANRRRTCFCVAGVHHGIKFAYPFLREM